jgi:hypothetical protein
MEQQFHNPLWNRRKSCKYDEARTYRGRRTIKKIAELTNEYTPPADACNTYKVTFAMFKNSKTICINIFI